MAITLNKYAIQCEQMAIDSGKITVLSSARVHVYDISRSWRNLVDADKSPSETLPGWSEREKEAADVIKAALTYLQRIGCKNIEQLLKENLSINEPID